jgi:3'-phosphoadenosine 5'-phosphosulfate sulfotransferase (PAPS reductase)/FAD synthetase
MVNRKGGQNQRLAIMLGLLTKDAKHPIKANIPSGEKSGFNMEKYKFFLEAPFEISNKCCNHLKKNPAHKYYKDTGRVPITAQMASESRLRTQKWLQNSCNGFDLAIPTSNPMSFWTEQDVLRYIRERKLPICSVYGEIVTDDEELGQMQLFEIKDQPLHCTGCTRTGCVCCGFGAHMKGDKRFVDLKHTHPQMYRLLDIAKNNGYTMREAINWVNEHGNMAIKQ